jgi:hypothetical protein
MPLFQESWHQSPLLSLSWYLVLAATPVSFRSIPLFLESRHESPLLSLSWYLVLAATTTSATTAIPDLEVGPSTVLDGLDGVNNNSYSLRGQLFERLLSVDIDK